jgi:hypothetical protein
LITGSFEQIREAADGGGFVVDNEDFDLSLVLSAVE